MKANPRSAILRGALAAVLACGLMLPTGALAAESQNSETPPPAPGFGAAAAAPPADAPGPRGAPAAPGPPPAPQRREFRTGHHLRHRPLRGRCEP